MSESGGATSPAEENALRIRMRELEIREQEIKLTASLSDLGLRGTLAGALAGLLLVLLLAALSAWSKNVTITGTHLCIVTGVVAVAVVALGAFVFNRSAAVVLDFQKQSLALQTQRDQTERERDAKS